MFQKILIANRGEIACRVIRTARRMGIRTVAVYSDADKDGLHVLQADEAVWIGPPPALESYLNIERLLEACRATGAEAVHPGYGFLSENPQFAERLAEAGIVFIGPPPAAIRAMGDKIAAKRAARAAAVPVVPGDSDVARDADEAVRAARRIGYPVLLKAAAGGGGKGMRVAHDDAECRSGFERAASEARSAFGDGRVFLEKYISEPRHIEIQVLADRHGTIIHLGERECSLQRRHQKVIEESPSPLVEDAMRAAMGQQAVALARAVGYESAGTVEFLVDRERRFYFLEMNTRLQVEHPVTEFVTGLDLVEWMIRIAAGEPLPLRQSDITLRGWAVEARVYAEDPFRNFLPSAGRLVRYIPPAESPSLRVDTGVVEGSEVSIHYDPLIAKVIAHGPSRADATARLREALNEFYLRGVSHNISFLAALLHHPRLEAGTISTEFISQQYSQGFQPADVVHDEPGLLVAVAAAVHRRYMDRAARIRGQLPGYERRVSEEWTVVLGQDHHPVLVRPRGEGQAVVWRDETYHVISDWQFGQPLFRGTINGTPVCVQVERRNVKYRLTHRGAQVDVLVLTRRAAELLACMPAKPPRPGAKFLVSPMPGLLAQLLVDVGTPIKPGQPLAIVEAMKMENVLSAEGNGTVARILARVGETLSVDQPILEFE